MLSIPAFLQKIHLDSLFFIHALELQSWQKGLLLFIYNITADDLTTLLMNKLAVVKCQLKGFEHVDLFCEHTFA